MWFVYLTCMAHKTNASVVPVHFKEWDEQGIPYRKLAYLVWFTQTTSMNHVTHGEKKRRRRNIQTALHSPGMLCCLGKSPETLAPGNSRMSITAGAHTHTHTHTHTKRWITRGHTYTQRICPSQANERCQVSFKVLHALLTSLVLR